MGNKTKETISTQDAMDNLAAIMSIDMNNPPPLGIFKKNRIVTSEEEFGPETTPWLSGEGEGPILEILELTYRAIHNHLVKLYESPETNWESAKGIAVMMELIGESAKRAQDFLQFRLGKTLSSNVTDGEEFKALQKFYTQKFAKKIEGSENSGLDLPETGLSDFESVRADSEYELFYILNEEGKPYFKPEVLRHIKLSCDFEMGGDLEEDPLLKIQAMKDRDLHASASQILTECYPIITDFFKVAKNLQENELASSLSMAVMALFIAANPRYLLQNTAAKSCIDYFSDFHLFLKRAMKTSEYQKLIAYPPEKSDKMAHLLLYLVHSLARSFFERAGGVKLESIGLIHRMMRRGEEEKKKTKEPLLKADTIWNQFLLDDEKYRALLSKFPNGPLFKILDLLREEHEEEVTVSFNPISQHNLPSMLYEIEREGKKIHLLRIPSPTKQTLINKAEIDDEFRAFLRSLSQAKKKHLLINLQDRTSWKEYARSSALEKLQLNAEFNQQLFVLTLPKSTDFYYQINEYINLNKTEEFLIALKAQIQSFEECGFFFPAELKKQELIHFVDRSLPFIHKTFFHNKNVLTRQNREDFIEIFYQFLVLKCIDLLHPSSLSFTCKDAIDTGAASSALFYGFFKLLTSQFKPKEDADFLRWLLYTPALFIRERAIDPERLNRALSALEQLHEELAEDGKNVLKAFEGL